MARDDYETASLGILESGASCDELVTTLEPAGVEVGASPVESG